MVDLLGFEDVLGVTNSVQEAEEDGDYFVKNFWGEKYQGFSILCNNLKHSQSSIKTLQEFIRERAATEDMYAKHLTKLAKSSTPTHSTNLGSFSPMFDILRSMSEKLSSCHMDTVLKLNDIIKELGKYQEEYKSRIKQMKERINSTHEALQLTQSTSNNVMKTKEKYHNQCMLIERLKAEDPNAKEIEKLESKSKKAADDYRANVEKHSKSRVTYEAKMTESCKKFQEVEEFHLKRMKKFLDSYVQSFENTSILVSQVHREIQAKVNTNTVRALVKQYCQTKGTGADRPTPLSFEECDTSGSMLISIDHPNTAPTTLIAATHHQHPVNLQQASSVASLPASNPTTSNNVAPPPSNNAATANQTLPLDSQNGMGAPEEAQQQQPVKPSRLPIARKLPFIRMKGTKKESKKTRSSSSGNKESADKDSVVSASSPEKEGGGSMNVDEEGYTIRPETPKEGSGNNWKYGSSDDSSNSDSDDDIMHKKIQIKIRPKEETPTTDHGNLEAIAQSLTLHAPNSTGAKKSPSSGSARSLSSRKASSADSSSQVIDLFANHSQRSSPSTTAPAAIPRPMSAMSGVINSNHHHRASDAEEDLFASSFTAPMPPLVGERRNISSVSTPTTLLPTRDKSGECAGDAAVSDDRLTTTAPTATTTATNTAGNSTWPTRKTASHPVLTTDVANSTSKPRGAPLATSESWSSSMSGAESSGATTPSFEIAGFNSMSRGPSPLTLSHSDTIPIAVAFTETVDAYITSSPQNQYLAKVGGELQISFPAGIVRTFTSNPNPPTLSFKIKRIPALLELKPNPNLLQMDSSHNEESTSSFWFNMSELIARIKKMTDANPNALYYNISIISYQMGPVHNKDLLPLHFGCQWNANVENSSADIKLNYSYNKNACTCSLKNLTFMLPVNTNVTSVQTTPPANWKEKEKRLVWTVPTSLLPTSSQSLISGTVSLEGKPPASPLKLAAVFAVEGATLTGTDFELNGTGYRLSLIKRRFKSGKYFYTTSST